jgi:hypothetical protein
MQANARHATQTREAQRKHFPTISAFTVETPKGKGRFGCPKRPSKNRVEAN